MGRPQKDINATQVRRLAEIQCTLEEIAAVMSCSVDTLERRFADVIKAGKECGKKSLRRVQWDMAKKGNATMALWLGKQYLGQRDYREPSDEELNAAIRRGLAQLSEARKAADAGKHSERTEPAAAPDADHDTMH